MMGHMPFFAEAPRFINSAGKLVGQLPETGRDTEKLLAFYRNMVLTRQFDKKAIALQRTGKMGTYASTLGQEAIGTAIGFAMQAEDVFVPYYRDTATQLLRGVKMEEILLYWGGDERGNQFSECPNDLPNCVPIATQALHATGAASALKIRGVKQAVVTTCGDGATSKGDFMEALNVAGAWQLPVVFVVNNNQWAISVPRDLQCNAPTLAQKAVGAGIEGFQVDGNDVVAVHEAVQTALEKARAGKGPTLIEAVTYRLCDHTTADDATRYGNPEALNKAWEKEPIKRLRSFLHESNCWNEKQELTLQERMQARVEAAVDKYLNMPAQPPEAMFDHLYAHLPHSLEQQYEEVKAKQPPQATEE